MPADAERLHRRLIDGLLRDGALTDARVEAAFRAVRRHWFLPGANVDDVYRDRALVTQRGADGVPTSSSSQPALMALMLEQLDVRPGMAVLEIGTGTGYNAALLGQLAGPGGSVLTLDVDPGITGPARRHLAEAGAANVTVETGDAWELGAGGTFDRVVATVGVWDLAPAWVERLDADGRIVVPLWLRAGQQASVAFRRAGAGLTSLSVQPCGFMRMRGAGAGEAAYRRVGAWTVSVDHHDPARVSALASLLAGGPAAPTRAPPGPLPALRRGWFTAIALAEAGAVSLFTEGEHGSVVRQGLLDESPPGLAVVESRPGAPDRLVALGSDATSARLLDLLRRRPALDLSRLSVTAVPTGHRVPRQPVVATLPRPNFTYTVW